MFNYLKTTEVADYVKREEAIEGDELFWCIASTSLVDFHCRRSLAIQRYSKSIMLNASAVGRIIETPFIEFTPQDTTTGFRVKELGRDIRGGYVTQGRWFDIDIPTLLEDIVDKRTGRIEITSYFDTDYGRLSSGRRTGNTRVTGYDAIVEFTGGYFLDTTTSAVALADQNVIVVRSVTGLVEGSSITIGDSSPTEYVVEEITGLTLTLGTDLAEDVESGTGVYGAVPTVIKSACGMIIEDRLTYAPNTHKQRERLDVLTTVLERMNKRPLPSDAVGLLAKYRANLG